MKKKKKQSSLLKNFLLACLVVFLIGELGIRIFLPEGRSRWAKEINSLHRNLRPYSMFSNGEPLGYDAHGTKIPMPKPSEEYRIFILGGSTVYIGSPPFSKLVETRLNQQAHSAKRLTIYNQGVVSQNSAQELSHLVHDYVELSPDLVVFYDGANDLIDPYFVDPRPNYPFNFSLQENNPFLNSNVNQYPLLSLTLFGSGVLRELFPKFFLDRIFKIEELRQKVGYLSPDWREKIAESYVSNQIKASKFAQAFGIHAFTVFQPTLYFKNRLSHAELMNVSGSMSDPRSPYVQLRSIRDLIQDKLKVSRLEYSDLSGIFAQSSDEVFYDHVHSTQAGLDQIADHLTHELIARRKKFGF